MDQVKKMLFALLSNVLKVILARKKIAVYICFAALYCILCGMISFALMVLTVLQWFFVLILTKPNPAIKRLSHWLTVYIYRMLRYVVLCESRKPYPFGPIPQEIEPAEEPDLKAEPPEKNFFDRAADNSSGPTADAGRTDPSRTDME